MSEVRRGREDVAERRGRVPPHYSHHVQRPISCELVKESRPQLEQHYDPLSITGN